MSAKSQRMILAVLEEAGPLTPRLLDAATGLTPADRAVELGRLWRDGAVTCVPPASGRGPVAWQLPHDLTTPSSATTVSPRAGTAAPNPEAIPAEKREENSMADERGTWTNRETGGAVLTYGARDAQSWDVYVEDADLPIPVIAATPEDANRAIRANGMTPTRVAPADAAHLPASPGAADTSSKEQTVTDQIAEGLAASESADDIDALLDSAATGEATKADAAKPQAKPDPKPNAKAAGKKGGTRADGSKGGSRSTSKVKPATRAEATRTAQAKRRTTKAAATQKAEKAAKTVADKPARKAPTNVEAPAGVERGATVVIADPSQLREKRVAELTERGMIKNGKSLPGRVRRILGNRAFIAFENDPDSPLWVRVDHLAAAK